MALSSGGAYILVWETTLQAIIMKQCDVCSNISMYQMPGSPWKERDLFSIGFKRRSKEVTL